MIIDIALGCASYGARVTRDVTSVALVPARVAVATPLGRPVRALGRRLAEEGATQRVLLRAEAETQVDAVLVGPITEQAAARLAEHRVVERIARELVARGAITAIVADALEQSDDVASTVLAHPATERLLLQVLNSRLMIDFTARLMESTEMQQVLEHVANSPEIRAVVTQQGSGMADDLVAAARGRAAAMDDGAERKVRGWLHRPRATPS